MSPRFDHDCDNCRFCGEYDGKDLWICVDRDSSSVLLRYGNDGPEYESCNTRFFRHHEGDYWHRALQQALNKGGD